MADTITFSHPDITAYSDQIESIRADFAALTDNLTESQFGWTPDPSRWSIGRCVEHLNVTGTLQLETIRAAVEQLRKENRTTDRPFRFGFLARKFLQSLEPPVKRRFRAPKAFRPALPLSPSKQRERFLLLQDDLQRLLRDADGLDLTAVKVASPAARWLRFPAAVWLASIPAHERRHLWQMRQLLAEPGFPAAR